MTHSCDENQYWRGSADGSSIARHLGVCVLIGLCATFNCSPARAQEAKAPEASAQGLEDILVTATKMEANIQDIPIAVSALSSETLFRLGVSNPWDLSGLAPSTIISSTAGALQVSIRGIGNDIISAGVGEPGIAFHSNGVYMGSQRAAAGTAFLDVDRIEILRGPQGTLWGRNSEGGTVNVIQMRPTEKLDGYLRTEYGSFDTYSIEAAIGGPVSDDTVLGRLAVKYRSSDGYLKNLSGGKDLGGDGTLGLRGSMLFNFSDDVDLLVAAGYSSSSYDGYAMKTEGTAEPAAQYVTILPGITPPVTPAFVPESVMEAQYGPVSPRGRFAAYVTGTDSVDSDTYYGTAELNVRFDQVTLTSLTSYLNYSNDTKLDQDNTNSQVESFFTHTWEDSDEFSEELRLASNGSGALKWLLGLYYYDSSIDAPLEVTSGPFPSYTNPFGVCFPGLGCIPWFQATIAGQVHIDSTSYAGFGQVTYSLTDDLDLTAGVRYSDDNKDEKQKSAFAGGGPENLPAWSTIEWSRDSGDWSKWTGNVDLAYKFNDGDSLVYGRIAEGYNPGGINTDGTGAFDDSTVLTYELGYKSELMDGRARLNVAAYYSDYKAYHIQFISGFSSVIGNADATVKGVELEGALLATEHFELDGFAAWQDSEITSYGSYGGAPIINPATFTTPKTGGPLPRSPEWQYSLTANYHTPITAEGNVLSMWLKYYWQDDVNLDPFGTLNASQDSYGTVDAGVGFEDSDGRWLVEAFGKNLTDEYIKSSVYFQPISLGSPAMALISPARSYGLRFSYNFGL